LGRKAGIVFSDGSGELLELEGAGFTDPSTAVGGIAEAGATGLTVCCKVEPDQFQTIIPPMLESAPKNTAQKAAQMIARKVFGAPPTLIFSTSFPISM